MRIARETWVVATLGVVDLITTIVFIQRHGAEEANPLFHHYWKMGLVDFIIAKAVLLAAPLFVLEWARKHKPRFVSGAMRGAIVAYLAMYLIGFIRLNGPAANAEEVVRGDHRSVMQEANIMEDPNAMPDLSDYAIARYRSRCGQAQSTLARPCRAK